MTDNNLDAFKDEFEKILNRMQETVNEDFFYERWGSYYTENGKWNVKKIKLLEIKLISKKIQDDESYGNLTEKFLEIINPDASIKQIEMDKIQLNELQARKINVTKDLEIFSEQIRSVGLIQPIVVYQSGDNYELLVGQRRYYACKDFLKWKTIRAEVIKKTDDSKISSLNLKEFVKTYLYKANNLKFNEDVLIETFNALQKRIAKNYSKMRFFFTPLYNFDSESEFRFNENFIVRKISPAEFDRITDLNFSNIHEDKPEIDYELRKLKYLLVFSTDKTDNIYPKEVSQSFLESLRILKKGDLAFGASYNFHPDEWQSDFKPATKEKSVNYREPMDFKETDVDELEKIFSKLTILNDKMKCQNHSIFEKECKSCSKNFDKIRYLKYSIRRFQYIYHETEIEDKITDLMISLEVLLNHEPFEVRDKTSTRAATILEVDDSKKPDCKKFIQKCYDIRSEIVHGKKRKTHVKDGVKTLSDEEVKEKLESYARKAIIKFINFQIELEDQPQVLEKIDSLFWR